MSRFTRREFLHWTAAASAFACIGPKTLAARLASLAGFITGAKSKICCHDTVTLGQTGIKTSRLAMGTGTVGSGHHSNQTALGIDGLSRLLQNGYDNGLRFFDAADSYGSHPHVAEALKHVDRSKVTLLTKSWARSASEMNADLERFRRELGTDHLDIVLMHCVTEGDWTTRYRGAMDALSEAKQKGIIRAHGCSCHTIEALRPPPSLLGSRSTWLASIPLARTWMPNRRWSSACSVRCAAAGKGVVGMKILGQGDMRNRQNEALNYALGLGVLDAFTIGAESINEQNDLMKRIAAA